MNESNKKIIIRCRGIILHDNKLLVVRHAPDAEYFTLPGGHLEWGETVLDTIKREIFEELGIQPIIGRLLYVNNYVDINFVQSVEFFFEITNSGDYFDTDNLGGSHKAEIAEMCWVGKQQKMEIVPPEIQTDLNNGTILANEIRYI
jgi:ADP-ribose pyrophosphatase YjhB (NUDIX family)